VTKRFRWDDWNRKHVDKHNVSESEAEYIVRNAQAPFPRNTGNKKQLVWGRTEAGRYLQVVYIHDSDNELDYEKLSLEDILLLTADEGPPIYVIHARDLSASEKRSYRRIR
jgi:uncharacterized DUF497 family protein